MKEQYSLYRWWMNNLTQMEHKFSLSETPLSDGIYFDNDNHMVPSLFIWTFCTLLNVYKMSSIYKNKTLICWQTNLKSIFTRDIWNTYLKKKLNSSLNTRLVIFTMLELVILLIFRYDQQYGRGGSSTELANYHCICRHYI